MPLGEESEAYALTILDGGVARRTVSLTTPAYTYPSAEQSADFGAPIAAGGPIEIEVSQISATFGPGAPMRRNLTV